MELANINILVWDSLENFHLPETQRQFGNNKLYKSVTPFQSSEEFEKLLSNLGDSDLVVICCHVKYEDLSGYMNFRNSRIQHDYGLANVVYLSSGSSSTVMAKIRNDMNMSVAVILYNDLIVGIQAGHITPVAKGELMKKGKTHEIKFSEIGRYKFPHIKYAIITALFQHEFQEIGNFIEFPEEEIITTEKIEFHVGYLKARKEVKVVAGIPRATGMVDAAIISSLILEYFQPEYLIMTGVCGGIPKLKFGDIVVAKEVFVFQKGKISDREPVIDGNGDEHRELYNENKELIDLSKIYDSAGQQVAVSVEKFEIEQDSIIEMDPLISSVLERKLKWIKDEINKEIAAFDKEVDIIMEPIACSTMVINKKGYFEDFIKPVNRKTAAVEMESYGVARACMFANGGKTKAIIFKGVMDNMKDKDDKAKQLAANVSARFLYHLLNSVLVDNNFGDS